MASVLITNSGRPRRALAVLDAVLPTDELEAADEETAPRPDPLLGCLGGVVCFVSAAAGRGGVRCRLLVVVFFPFAGGLDPSVFRVDTTISLCDESEEQYTKGLIV